MDVVPQIKLPGLSNLFTADMLLVKDPCLVSKVLYILLLFYIYKKTASNSNKRLYTGCLKNFGHVELCKKNR